MTVKLPRRVLTFLLIAAGLMLVLLSVSTTVRAQQIVASWYGPGFEGRTTAYGETFNPNEYTAASLDYAYNTKLIVTYNDRSVVVRVNDKGPYVEGRDIDLSQAAAEYIGLIAVGSDVVEVIRADPSTPVGPYSGGTSGSQPATQPDSSTQAPSEPEQSAPEPEAQPSEPAESVSQEPSQPAETSQSTPTTPEQAGQPSTTQGSQYGQYSEESRAGEQYDSGDGVDDNVADAQYGNGNANADAASNVEEQYSKSDGNAEDQEQGEDSAATGQYSNGGANGNGDSNAKEQYESSVPPQSSPEPATVNDEVNTSELQAPPAELVKPGSTVERRIELGLAAAPADEPQTLQQSGEDTAQQPAQDTSSADKAVEEPQAQQPVESLQQSAEDTSADNSVVRESQAQQPAEDTSASDAAAEQAQAQQPAEDAGGGKTERNSPEAPPSSPEQPQNEEYNPEPQGENGTAPAGNRQYDEGPGLRVLPDTGSALPLTALAGGALLLGVGGLLRRLTEW